MSEDKPVNYYEHVQKKFKEEKRTYPNHSKVQIGLPFRMVIVGSSGSGKTNAVLNLVEKINAFDRIILFAKDVTEPLYADFIDRMRKAEKESKKEILIVGTKIEDLPGVDTNSKDNETLLIVDDMVTEKHSALHKVVEYWTRGRKKNVSCIYLSQAYYKVPLLIRQNSDYIVLTKIRTKRDLKTILSEYTLGVDDKELERLYLQATKGGFPNYFLIDLAAGTGDQNANLRFRRNFEPLAAHSETPEGDEGKAATKGNEGKKSAPIKSHAPIAHRKLKPAKEVNTGDKRERLVPPPPPPPPDSSLTKIKAWVEKIHEMREDGDISMEDVENAMQDMDMQTFVKVQDIMEDLDPNFQIVHPDRDEEMGSGFKKKKTKRQKRVGGRLEAYHKKRPKLSTSTEKELERMLGFRVRPYWH
jgi:hypothetical protein